MQSNTAVELLKLLNEDEIKDLREFLLSPVFNKRKEMVKIFEVIIRFRPEYSHRNLDKEKLFGKIYPGKKFNGKSLSVRLAELSALIREFLAFKGYKKNDIHKKILLANELNLREKYSMSEKYLNEALNNLENDKINDPKYFENKYNILTGLCEVFAAEYDYKKRINSEIKKAECLLSFLLIELLNNAATIITINVNNKEFRDSSLVNHFLENISVSSYLEYLKDSGNEQYPVVAIYYYAYMNRKEPDNEKHYYDMKEIIFREYGRFSKQDQFKFYNFLSRAFYPGLFKKDKKFFMERHIIDKFFNELDVFLTLNGKYMYPEIYNNAFNTAILVNEFDWAEQFITGNKNKLLPGIRENTFNYCMAMLCNKRNDFNRSIDFLSKIKFPELSYNLDVRVCYIINYYELNLYDQLIASIDSYKHFISDSRNLPEHIMSWAQISLRFITKITNAKFGNKKLDYAELKEAESFQNFMARRWIIEKIKELV